jgi:hypothetical protein
MSTEDRVEQIAQVCHEANRSYCLTLGDDSQPPWSNAEDWQKTSAVNGVHFLLHHPDAGPEACHENWMKEKQAQGWVYGSVKQPDARQHPCLVSWSALDYDQQLKDKLFHSIVRAMQ